MKVKKYTASTIKEALAKIRQELGDDALIISTREMTGTLGRKFVEVTAASDDKSETTSSRSTSVLSTTGLEEQIVRNRVLLSESLKPLKEELFHIRSMVNEMRRQQEKADNVEQLHTEMKDLKRLFAVLTRQAKLDVAIDFDEPVKEIYKRLLTNEVDESLSYQLVDMLNSRLSEEDRKNPLVVRKRMREMFARILVTAKPVALNNQRPYVMAFVGPTGVGKTTTIAKLAARCSLQMRRKVCLITIDTYRIAAVEQLKTYARIMNLPIHVCYSVGEMRKAISENRDSSLILIDTAGRSQADAEQVKDLRTYFAEDKDIDVLLGLSATTKNNDLRDITKRYEPVGVRKLVFTKLDETTTYGPILNESVRTRMPIAYFTTGQNVPDDIEAASSVKLAGLLLGDA
jgi:flagellar biosynthesis protein FlhF